MAKTILIQNGRIIDPANDFDAKADLLIVDGVIEKIGNIDQKADTVINAGGKIVSPGLIDVHVHFREPGDEEEETIASGSMAAVPAPEDFKSETTPGFGFDFKNAAIGVSPIFGKPLWDL